MTVAVWTAVAILAVAVLLALRQVRRATDGASIAVVGDLVYFSGIGMLVLLSSARGSAAVVEAALLASLVGILATIALARIVTRGRR